MTLVLLCVLIAVVMPVVCAGIAKAGRFRVSRHEGGYDNHLPRDWLARQTGYRARANAAQANSFEALPFFIGAVAIALALGAPQARVELLALAWLLLRAAYVACYLADKATPRSLVWGLAFAVNVAILFAATY